MRPGLSLHRELSRVAWAPAAFAAVLAGALIPLAGRYGPHGDELYFVAAGKHLAVAYPDQGPVTPLIARGMTELSGSLTVLRAPAALMAALVVVVTGLIARELGGDRRMQTVAALCMAISAMNMQVGHLLTTSTFDLLVWTVVTWLVVRALRTGSDRLWIVAGVVLGVGLLNKPLPAFLAVGLLAGVVIAGPRELLRNRWAWAGALIALLIWSPWIVWQARHGWPQIDVSRSIAAGNSTSSQPVWAFLPFQLLLVSPFLAPVWIAGLVRLWRGPPAFRLFAWAWGVMAVVFMASGGKPYYIAGMFPLLLAAGAEPAVRWLERGRLRMAGFGLAVVVTVAVVSVLMLPVLPRDKLDPVIAANPDVGSTVGWPGEVRTVASVYRRSHARVVLASDYSEAGAIDRYGPGLGLPRAYSGHNGYGYWGHPPGARAPVVAIGFDPGELSPWLYGCTVSARVRVPGDIDNDENGARVWTCRNLRAPWSELWPKIRSLG